jgi:hypothetical protein
VDETTLDPTKPTVRRTGRRLHIHDSCFSVMRSPPEQSAWNILLMDDVVPGQNRTQWSRLSRGDLARIGLWFLARALRP